MKVKVLVRRLEEVEVEIDDKFGRLAVPYPWEDKTIPDELVDEAISAVTSAVLLPFGDDDGDNDNYIDSVYSAENGYTMLEW